MTVNNFLKLLLYLKILSCYTDVMGESSESDKNYQRILNEQKQAEEAMERAYLTGKFDHIDTQFEKDVAEYLKYLISHEKESI